MGPAAPNGRSRRGRGRGLGRGRQQASTRQEDVMTVPQMTIPEIMEDLRNFECAVNVEVVKKPNSDVVHGVFMFFMDELYGEMVEVMLQPMQKIDEDYTEFGVLHTEALETYHLLGAFNTMLIDAKYYDFRLYDILEPDAKRFRTQLSALLNLAKYRRSRLETWERQEQEEDNTRERHAQLTQQLAEVRAEVDSIERARDNEMSEVNRHKEVVRELVVEHERLDAQRIHLTKETGNIKSTLAQTRARTERLRNEATRIQGEVAANKQLIVPEPDRVLSELRDLQKAHDRATGELTEVRTRRDGYTTRERNLRTAIPILRECEAAAELAAGRYADLQKEKVLVGEARAREIRVRARNTEDTATLEALQRSVEAMIARRERAQTQREHFEATVREDEEKWQQEENEIRVFAKACREKGHALKKRMAAISREIEQATLETSNVMARVDAKQSELLLATRRHASEVREIMALFVTDSKAALAELDIVGRKE